MKCLNGTHSFNQGKVMLSIYPTACVLTCVLYFIKGLLTTNNHYYHHPQPMHANRFYSLFPVSCHHTFKVNASRFTSTNNLLRSAKSSSYKENLGQCNEWNYLARGVPKISYF